MAKPDVKAGIDSAKPDLSNLSGDVIARAAAGDIQAERLVMEASLSFVRGMLLRFSGRTNELDDLVQMTLLSMHRNLTKYRAEASFRSWVGSICVNVAKDHLRRRRRSRIHVGAEGDEYLVENLEGGNLTSQLEARSLVRECVRALDALSPVQRVVYVLFVFEGHSLDEIAAMTKAAKSTTRLRLYYARKAFARALENK